MFCSTRGSSLRQDSVPSNLKFRPQNPAKSISSTCKPKFQALFLACFLSSCTLAHHLNQREQDTNH